MSFSAGQFDIAVIGAGHAGIEAALASARMGCTVLCVCTSLDGIGNMPCNPSIGGTAKGQLVREIDALGGQMARTADDTCLQFRMLNRGKGPAVHSPRAQSDRMEYRTHMRDVLEHTDNLVLVQGECVDILTEGNKVSGIVLSGGAQYCTKAVVLATGTFLRAKTFVGSVVRDMGPDGMYAACDLSSALTRMGFELRRFKTGTPPRIDGRTVDFSKMTPQRGDDDLYCGFAFGSGVPKNVLTCYLAYSNETTHDIIRASLDRSPLFSGDIEGVGPRYCPSIEDKIVRFADKNRHQLFLEPCGEHSTEYYLQGMSTSLPEDVQIAFVRSVEGMENAHIMRPGYAIEYDCIDSRSLTATMEARQFHGLYFAGQVCGSSGYEEAAAQGLIAGINAALQIQQKPPFTLKRSDGYIGTLIDDLIVRGADEPYRMMTSRSEYRLIARQDNADKRLMPYGASLGLVSAQRLSECEHVQTLTATEIKRLKKMVAPPSDSVNAFLAKMGTAPIVLRGVTFAELLRRPQINYSALAEIDDARPELPPQVCEQVEIEIKYEGYIERQLREIEQQRKMEDKALPTDIDYFSIASVRTEARQKLDKVRPETFGQASRISGVSPSDIAALMIHLSGKGGQNV